MTIGLPTIRRPQDQNYLYKTLRSLIANSNDAEQSETVVVIALCDFDYEWNHLTNASLHIEFDKYFKSGFFRTIEAPLNHYPPLNETTRANGNDPKSRIKWRSKQNIDFAFLMLYSRFVSYYYIQLEDDVLCANNYIRDIKSFISSSSSKNWTCLEFTILGFIGKLFRSLDLDTVAHMILALYQYQPCDIILGHIYRLMGQTNPIHHKPSLFQHIGKWSSLENKIMPSWDNTFKDFGKIPLEIIKMPNGDNPVASIETDMLHPVDNKPEYAYEQQNDSFFWAKSPAKGNYYSVVFAQPQNISRIIISTGDARKKNDYLESAYILISITYPCHTHGSARTIGKFIEGEFDSSVVGSRIPLDVRCVSVSVIESQQKWVIFRQIEIFLKK